MQITKLLYISFNSDRFLDFVDHVLGEIWY